MKHSFFWIAVSIGTIIYICQRLGISLPWYINNYLNDLLIVPIVLYIARFLLRKMYHQPQLSISLPMTLAMVTFYALFFELLMPKVMQRYTADWIDVFLYFLGGIVFYLFQNKKPA